MIFVGGKLLTCFYSFMTALFAALIMVPFLRQWALDKDTSRWGSKYSITEPCSTLHLSTRCVMTFQTHDVSDTWPACALFLGAWQPLQEDKASW